jgi:hypothetical protein
MTRLTPLPRRPRAHHARARTGAVGLAVALLLSLAACKGDDSGPLTPAGAALVASAPAVAATKVPPPPVIQSVSTDTPAAGDLASAESRLDTTLTQAAACTADTECRTVAVGAKACGGPTGYRAYSGKTVSPDSVEALAQHERELAAAQAKASHQVSPCFMLADPGARCVQNKCVTGRAGP